MDSDFVIPLGYTASDLTRKLGVDRSQVSRWVSGKITPSTETLRKVEAVERLGVTFLAKTEKCSKCNGNSYDVILPSGERSTWCSSCFTGGK